MIKVGIIGGGYDSTIAKCHLRALRATNKFEVVAGFFSRSKNKINNNSKFYNLSKNKIYNNLNSFLKNEKKNIDLCIVLTPPVDRYIIYKELVKNNIKFITEKPFESNYQNSLKAYKLLRKKNLFLGSTYNYLNYPALMEIPNLLKKIGKINYFRFEMPQQSSVFYKNLIKKWRLKDSNNIPNLYLDLAN